MSAVASRLQQQSPEPDEYRVVLDDPDTAPLVPDFLRNRRDDVEAIRSLLEAADFGRVQSLGHRMKGTGKSYGFATISRIGASIEQAAHQNDAAAIEQLVNDLAAYLDRVKVESPPDERQ
jgi:HPt (histidine-containing phosphotransfer) domain-containing protein